MAIGYQMSCIEQLIIDQEWHETYRIQTTRESETGANRARPAIRGIKNPNRIQRVAAALNGNGFKLLIQVSKKETR